jgi:hypothetical protein
MTGKSWTTKKVESVWRRMRAGTSAQTIAADMGCTVTNIHKRLRGAGYDPAGGRRDDIDDDAKLILARRLEGKEFVEIAVELGMEPTRLSVRRVYMRLARYCERAEIKYPRAVKKRGHKRYSPASVEPLMIADAVVAINKRLKRDEQTDALDLADETGYPERTTKCIIAEMRRKKMLADGIVPTVGNPEPDDLIGCERAVLDAVRAAWADKKRSCETLTSLVVTTGYARSSINLAIVRLRDRGLLEPRGFLYLREI